MNQQDIYRVVFKDQPDILSVEQMSQMLKVSRKTAYKLLSQGKITAIKVGREYKIPKTNILRYLKVFGEK